MDTRHEAWRWELALELVAINGGFAYLAEARAAWHAEAPLRLVGEFRPLLAHRNGSWRCAYCGVKPPITQLQVDHVHPYSRRATYPGPNIHEIANLDLACRSCNASKGAKLLHTEWRPPAPQMVGFKGWVPVVWREGVQGG